MIEPSTAFLVWLMSVRTPFGLSFFTKITEFGGIAAIVIIGVVAVFVLWRGRAWAHALGLIVALVGSVAVMELMKVILKFPRPDIALHAVIESGYSFPSGHATASMAMYGFLAWCIWEKSPRWRVPTVLFFVLLILLIGFSRLYLGVHFPIDIIGGYLLGAIFIYLGYRITRRLERYEV